MSIFKKIYKWCLLSFLFLLSTANVYAAQSALPGPVVNSGACATGRFCNPLGSINSFSALVSAVLKIVVSFGIPIAALAIIFSGFLLVVAQGNEEKLKTAKRAFLWSVVGTAVLLGAWAISTAIGTTVKSLM